MTAGPDVYVGLDLGTSGLKGVALTASGEVVARGSAAYPTHRPARGAREQEPQDWITAVEAVADQIGELVAPRRWQGMGLSAMLPTLVTAGADGKPVGPAITWQDSRSDKLGDELRERCGADALYQLTGQWVDGRYLLPMFMRVAMQEPARAAATTWLLGAKDYLFGWLTGETATDPSTASGFGCYALEAGDWDHDVLAAAWSMADRAGSPAPLRPSVPSAPAAPSAPSVPGRPALPPVLPSTTCRRLRAAAAARLGCGQIPVCLGAADSVLGALGLGVRDPGQIAYIAGTSNVIMGVSDRLLLDPLHRFLVTPLAEPGRWGLEMDLLATGSAISWLAGLLAGIPDESALVALAAATDPRDAPLILPYLSPGEQGALWDPLLHGTFVGLELRHGPRHLARGLVNGIVLESRRCLSVLDEAARFGRQIEVAGSSAADPAFRADLADATRRLVAMPGDHDTDYSARGAALLAARGIGGEWPARSSPGIGPAGIEPLDIAAAGIGEAGIGEAGIGAPDIAPVVAEPDPGRAVMWDEIWASYEQARRAVASHYHANTAPLAPRELPHPVP